MADSVVCEIRTVYFTKRQRSRGNFTSNCECAYDFQCGMYTGVAATDSVDG